MAKAVGGYSGQLDCRTTLLPTPDARKDSCPVLA